MTRVITRGSVIDIMLRTQISLSHADYRLVKQEARRLGIPIAELMRRALRAVLPADTSRPWMRFAGFVESGDSHASTNIDAVVYGQKD